MNISPKWEELKKRKAARKEVAHKNMIANFQRLEFADSCDLLTRQMNNSLNYYASIKREGAAA